MARRKSPPLYELMRESARRAEAGGNGSTRPMPSPVLSGSRPAPSPGSRVLRFPDTPPVEAPPGEMATERAAAANPLAGLNLAGTSLWIAVGVALCVVVLTWVVAYQTGARHEARQWNKLSPPPEGVIDGAGTRPPAGPGLGASTAARPQAAEQARGPAPREAPRPPPAKEPAGAEVFGDDPREVGINYLVIERLPLDDAKSAAKFLTDNGVPSVVVAPEGEDPATVQKTPKGVWCVIAREGLTSEQYRAGTVRDSLSAKVQQLGRRWKSEHRGTSDFQHCVWDKYNR